MQNYLLTKKLKKYQINKICNAAEKKIQSRILCLEQDAQNHNKKINIHEQSNPKRMHRHLCPQIKNAISQRKLQEQVPEPNIQMVYANKRNPRAYPK